MSGQGAGGVAAALHDGVHACGQAVGEGDQTLRDDALPGSWGCVKPVMRAGRMTASRME